MATKTADWRLGPTVCRCCLAEGCYKDISTEYFWMGKREVYAEMLSDTFDVSIAYSQSTGPNSNSRLICEPCISRLRDASDFKRQVLECEKTFMQHLDPGRDPVPDVEVPLDPPEKEEVKLERVKLEEKVSDDDFDPGDFGNDPDDDDDDLDDQPLTKLASKIPKKESVDLQDLLDTARPRPDKRKAATKAKASPSKKAKKKETPKATASKVVAKPIEKKKKDNDANLIARQNAQIIVRYSTAYPFRLPEESMVCVYCAGSFNDPANYRSHMDEEHLVFKVQMAFYHCSEGYVKVDCTSLRCRVCSEPFDDLQAIANHLILAHYKKLDLNHDLGVQPFKIEKDKYLCAICCGKFVSLRHLSRHTQSHFLKYTCESCGKSYSTCTSLNNHIKFSHSGNERICRKCRSTFSTLEAKKAHMSANPKCWSHLCSTCGKRFLTWNLKQVHMSQVHGTQKKTYVCPECPEVFTHRRKYRSHFKISHTDDNFVCSCCRLKFASKRELEEHRVIHTKERLFPCTVCSKSFPRKKNLSQHMWVHSEHKRFSCTLCNKLFNQRVSWKSHMRSYHPELVEFEDGKNNLKLLFSVLKKDF